MDVLILVICIISLIVSVGCLIAAIYLFKSIKGLKENGITDKKLDEIKESVYNEFKKNDISVPFAQLEVRNRTDKVVMPFNKEALPERVEKERKTEKHFDLETADLVGLLKNTGKKKKAKKSEKAENKETK